MPRLQRPASAFKAADVVGCFRQAAAVYGDPATVLSDNGAVFTGRYRGGGRVALEVTLNRPRHRASATPGPTTPRPAARSSASTRRSRRWLATQPPARTAASLQTQLDTFTAYYNATRPHRALGGAPPPRPIAARPKARPSGIPRTTPTAASDMTRVDANGKLTLRHNSRLHHIGIGRRHAGRRVLILINDRHIRVSPTNGELLRDLLLDPSRDYQPQPKT